jgi:hypothetical protein
MNGPVHRMAVFGFEEFHQVPFAMAAGEKLDLDLPPDWQVAGV